MDPQIPIKNSEQASLIVVPVVFNLMAVVAVSLRILARRVSNRNLDASDYMIIASLVIAMAFSAVIVAEPFTGAGLPMLEIQTTYGTAPIVTYLKMTLANQILWALSVCLPKLSVLLLCSRIFTTPGFVVAAKVTGVLTLLLAIATILGALLQCQPFAFNWDQTIAGGHCGDQVLSFKITGAINVFLDVVTLLLPMPYLTTLVMSTSKKLILIATFAVGFVTCVFSALRIESLVTMDYTNLTYLAVVPSIYSVIEPNIAITLSCVPLLRPLFGGKYSVKGTLIRRDWGTGDTSGANSSAARQPRKANRVGFQTLNDNVFQGNDASSQVELQPMGPKYEAEVSARAVDAHGVGQGGNASEGSMNSENADDRVESGIMVKQEWEVKEV